MQESPDLWMGLGCQHQTPREVFDHALQQVCQTYAIAPHRIAGLATLESKRTEPGLRAFGQAHQWPILYFAPADLAGIAVPHPSAQVQAKLGLTSVAEAAALKAAQQAGGTPTLLVPKQVYRGTFDHGAVTVAIVRVTFPLTSKI